MKVVFLIMNTGTIEQVVSRYPATSPMFRGLIQLIPCGIGSAIDVAVVTKLENIHKDKLREFFDELEKGAIPLTPEIIESEDFLHCYISTVRAALNTRRREKIRYFARLLTSSISSSEISTVDEYDECLSILDELSFRELGILIVLSRYEKKYSYQDGGSHIQKADQFWERFSSEVCSGFSIPREELNGMLIRLNRTGLYYETFIGSYESNRARGALTPLYAKLEKLIKPEDCEFE